jgi:hypothetical protein
MRELVHDVLDLRAEGGETEGRDKRGSMDAAGTDFTESENSLQKRCQQTPSEFPEELRKSRKENQKGELDSGDESGLRGRVISPAGLKCQHVFSVNPSKTWLDFLKRSQITTFPVFRFANKGIFCRSLRNSAKIAVAQPRSRTWLSG